jgi:hypothetical protein
VGTFLQALAALFADPEARTAARAARRITITAPEDVLSYPGLASRPPFPSGAQAHTSIVGVTATAVVCGTEGLGDVTAYNRSSTQALSDRIHLVAGAEWIVSLCGRDGTKTTLRLDGLDAAPERPEIPARVRVHPAVAALLDRLGDGDGVPLAALVDWTILEPTGARA